MAIGWNWLVSWCDDNELLLGADVIGWNFLKKITWQQEISIKKKINKGNQLYGNIIKMWCKI